MHCSSIRYPTSPLDAVLAYSCNVQCGNCIFERKWTTLAPLLEVYHYRKTIKQILEASPLDKEVKFEPQGRLDMLSKVQTIESILYMIEPPEFPEELGEFGHLPKVCAAMKFNAKRNNEERKCKAVKCEECMFNGDPVNKQEMTELLATVKAMEMIEVKNVD